MSKEIIELIDISKDYAGSEALSQINLTINKNEFVTLLGPSGCGKTTILRILGGFETPSCGSVLFDGEDLLKIPSHKRRINTVFQKYALFPHMNVFENIAFGLRIKKLDESTIHRKVGEMLELVNLYGFERREVHAMSGGQQQRIAIARALVNEPEVLLLDEPLGALDLKLRKDMQLELKKIQKHLGITFIYVTHDQEEALTMSDSVVVMKNGTIQQQGTPVDIYNEPINAFVADFIGESNIVDGIMHEDLLVSFSGRQFTCVDCGFLPDESIQVVVRPEDIKLHPTEGQLFGTVQSVTFKGVHYEMNVLTEDGQEWLVHSTQMQPESAHVGLTVYPDDIHIMRREGQV